MYQIENLRRILTNLGCKIYWCESQVQCSQQLTKKIILDNLSTHSNLFDFYNDSNKSASFEDNLVLAREANELKDFVIGLKRLSTQSSKQEVFENAKNYISMCSYRNQLVCFLIRKSFTCNALLSASSLVDESGLVFQQKSDIKASDEYAFLSRLFNREFIFQVSIFFSI